MYCSTIITIKSHHFIHPFIVLHATKCCCDKQVNKRQAVANAVALLSTVKNVVLKECTRHLAGQNKLVDRP